MITMGYKGRSTPQLSSWARFGHTIIATDFTITRRYHSDSFSCAQPAVSRIFKQQVSNLWIDVALSQHNLGDKG